MLAFEEVDAFDSNNCVLHHLPHQHQTVMAMGSQNIAKFAFYNEDDTSSPIQEYDLVTKFKDWNTYTKIIEKLGKN